jgi:pectinesterase
MPMKHLLRTFVLFSIISNVPLQNGRSRLFAAALPAGMKPDITVAQDGSGDFRGLQDAIDSIPANNTRRKTIFVKNGTYNEHILIENSFVTLLGEDRHRTKIVWEVNDPRYQTNPNENADRKGIASLNLRNASDIVVDNLTIDNPAKNGGKPFVVFSTGRGTRIIIQNAEVTGLGGDSLSLWTNGMYYHRNIHVTGTYHFVGPRGTCYMSDSLIECLGPVTNALFNEGMQDERQKFVLQRCRIVSKVPFGLGSNFRDAAWYFVDCQFPDTLKPDGKIFIAQSNVNNPQPVSAMFKWATDRIYFAGSIGPDYPWLKDNIDKSPAKKASEVTPAWTFWGQWDPESIAAPTITGTAVADDVLSVKFSESVTVQGRPTIKLSDGKFAEYVSGSGTDTLCFKAPTGAAPELLNLNGGMILASIASAQTRCLPDLLKLSKP